ncbi:MAG: bifunctional 2-methylcitrate dehydratase/aconitate hydratase [Gammaproteobacteria bacterium]|nr:bifunctional 2-methylcitrate dehydratase/aconitate hydratase [Gammaproteobacteria bacterium]
MQGADSNVRSKPDQLLVDIADYVVRRSPDSACAFETARWCLMDALGCAILALSIPECAQHLGPLVPGTQTPFGVRVPGTSFKCDPVKAAFDIGTLIRWLDYNDTWLAAEWGHPSDNCGAILAVADFLSEQRIAKKMPPLRMKDVLSALIKAYEIQGVLALENSFNRVGLDHVVLVKVASTALATYLLGGAKEDIIHAVSQAFVDGQSLRTYRHAPNVGSRKSWAAGDATSRAVRLAMLTLKGEKGCPTVLSAPKWGFCDVYFHGKPLRVPRSFGSNVIENILFKVSYPAEFHAQTAAECAIALHPTVQDKLDRIEKIIITTQESAIRIISKTGPLYNPADRDHSIQYIVAVALMKGDLKAEDYEEATASDPRIDLLRAKMEVIENPQFSKDYLDPEKRSIANSVQVFFKDGAQSELVVSEYPIGHPRRRKEAIPLLVKKFRANCETRFPSKQVETLYGLFCDLERFNALPVPEFMAMWGYPH